MNSVIQKTLDFPSNFTGNGAWLLEQLVDLHGELCSIFGIQGCTVSRRELREYEEGAGWFQFPCKEEKVVFESENARCSVAKTSMFNGHIGDTEENVVMLFESGESKIYMYVNLYASSISLKYEAVGVSESVSDRIESLLREKFDLSLPVKEEVIVADYDQTESTSVNPDDHYNYK